MGKIKSALEIAPERTESVASDKGSIGQFEVKQKGKRLANEFLAGTGESGGIKSLEKELKKVPAAELASLKQGIFDILITQIMLPAGPEELKRIEAAAQGLGIIVANKDFGEIAQQMGKILGQYLEEATKYEEAIKKQYAPKLRQKEEEISRRLGRQVKLDPSQDHEYVSFFNQNMNTLKSKYEEVIVQVKEEARRLFAL